VPAETLLSALKQAHVGRLLVTGGAAKAAARRGIAFLDTLGKETTIDWMFFSPAALSF
jgi:putative NADH-flavin reductase